MENVEVEATVHTEYTNTLPKSTCNESRKRNISELSDIDSNFEKIKYENKKQRNCIENNRPNVNHESLNELDIKSLVIGLSLELKSAVSTLSQQMTDLENRLEVKITEKLVSVMDRKFDSKIDNFKSEIRTELDTMKNKLNSVEKTYASVVKSKNLDTIDRGKNLIIKMLPNDKNETPNNNCLKNNVISMIRDGLKLRDVKVEKVERKQSNGPRPGVVVARLNSKQEKTTVLEKKMELRKTQKYRNVYIESDVAYETRVQNSNMRTILQEIGKMNDYKILQGKLVKNFQRNHNPYKRT
ncbi:unnamed protein product [Mytilus edulis]|uniref:Uncharacterized protein n=1 Tax=Mytilus edulis TaxID=6550 RepID=A0A8S3VD75_MYTED|nr:unnamed protein product [Mytilus edulis]